MLEEGVQRYARTFALVAVGGALGATSRYAVELGVPSSLGATLAANVAGCFLLGTLVAASRTRSVVAERERLLFGAGFCSSFTTYSTFVLGVVRSAPAVALAYLLVSYAGGFLAVAVGTATGSTAGGDSRA